MYKQKCMHYASIVPHMMRFYYSATGAKAEEMSNASWKAWEACDHAISMLTEAERRIVRAYYATDWTKSRTPPLQAVANDFGVNVRDVRVLIQKTVRLVTVRLGLADE